MQVVYCFLKCVSEARQRDQSLIEKWCPRRDSNPCYRRERAMSWARLDDEDTKKIPNCAGLAIGEPGWD